MSLAVAVASHRRERFLRAADEHVQLTTADMNVARCYGYFALHTFLKDRLGTHPGNDEVEAFADSIYPEFVSFADRITKANLIQAVHWSFFTAHGVGPEPEVDTNLVPIVAVVLIGILADDPRSTFRAMRPAADRWIDSLGLDLPR